MVVLRGVESWRSITRAFEQDPQLKLRQFAFLSDLKHVASVKQHLAGYLAAKGGRLAPTTALAASVQITVVPFVVRSA